MFSCPILASTLYLKVRHNQITKILYQAIIKSDHLILNPPEVTVKDGMEVWYNMEVQTTPKVEKNKPDIVIWEESERKCTIVEVMVPLDTNLQKAHREKTHKIHKPYIKDAKTVWRLQI